MQLSMVKEKINLVLYFLDSLTHEILIWKHIQIERVDDYKYLLVELLNLGYTILYVTIDVKRGVNSYPLQMCHFHQKRIIQRYITLNPKLEASQELKKIMTKLKYSDESRFSKALDIWYIKYKDFLNEITLPPYNRKYSFTYKNHNKLNLSNTTNLIEGGAFSPLKILSKIHRALSKSLKLKIVDVLLSYKKKE